MPSSDTAEQSVLSKDAVLVAALAYLVFDLFNTWDGFRECPSPIHKWLLGSYLIVITMRLISIGVSLMTYAKSSTHALLDLRQKSRGLRVLVSLTWWVIVPLILMWTAMGTKFTWQVLTQKPDCMPSPLHLLFVILWQLVCYAWLLFYCGLGAMAWFLERRLRRTEQDFRDLADPEMEQRWGDMSTLEGYTALPRAMASQGMAPGEILLLPGVHLCSAELAATDQDCSICLNNWQAGDQLRQLSVCGHTFHRSCVDLWLLRSSQCPLCKVGVAPGAEKQR
mmetsp:Transcript_44717/g.113775  ORF Transcript_44717/g.113775 Transcript_44717/m.113775 type:complete len:280 (-) Transcript_44717:103-942(-)